MLLPPMTGMIMHVNKWWHKAIASSYGQLFYNLFGFAPAPFFYGCFISWFPNCTKIENDICIINKSNGGVILL